MRLVHRLSQYQRLYQQLGSAPVAVTIGELAAMFYCSERHARTLVQQLQDLLSPHLGGQWQAGSPTLRIPYYRTLETLDPLT